MRSPLDAVIEIDDRAAATIVAAMREVALADGLHPNEAALLDSLEAELPSDASREVDLSTLHNDDLKQAFLWSLVLVAFADGQVSDQESEVVHAYSQRLGMSDRDVAKAISGVAGMLLSQLGGVKVYRDQVLALGRRMGLDEKTIQSILD